jgi:hypothetical protein
MDVWIPLMEFAIKKGVSLSTLRRYIKADKIQYRVESGRYLILDTDFQEAPHPAAPVQGPQASNNNSEMIRKLENKISAMSSELQRAQKEIAELQTLIAFYEHTGGTPIASSPRAKY